MSNTNYFTISDVREINQSSTDKKSSNMAKLTPTSQKFIRETRFTALDINQAFAAARRSIEREIGQV
ncbi:MAG: hypothetical protein WCP01_02705 [Methylococcaceae bacterium]|jgi:hypothetical protein